MAAEVDEHEVELVAERVEVVAEHVVVERRAAVDDEQRQAVAAALDDVDAGVGDLDVAAWHGATVPAPARAPGRDLTEVRLRLSRRGTKTRRFTLASQRL